MIEKMINNHPGKKNPEHLEHHKNLVQDNLREDWIECLLIEGCDIHDNLRKPINAKERNERINGKPQEQLFPYYGATGQVGLIDDYLTDGNFVLIGEDAAPFLDYSKDVAYQISGKTWVNNHAHILKSKFNDMFLLHYLNNFNYKDYVSGTTRLKLTQGRLKQIPIKIAPLPEQKAIVKKIEELFSSLDSGIADLKKAQDQLAIYRQAVLKKAFEGELTNTSLEIAFLNDHINSVEYGTSEKSLNEGEMPVLRMGNMQKGIIDWTDLKYTSNKSDIEKYILNYGDVLFNRTNSPEHVGKTSIFLSIRKAIFAGYIIRINYDKNKLSGKYLTYFLNSYKAKIYGNEVKTDGVNQSNINGSKLKKYPIPICSLEEQHQIVREIESRLSVCDKVEESIANSLEKAQALRQSILKKAFEGKLLSEAEITKCKADKDYEPASVLLERIRKKKSSAKASASKGKKKQK